MTRLKTRTERRITRLSNMRADLDEETARMLHERAAQHPQSGGSRFAEVVRSLEALTRAESAFQQIAELKRVAMQLSGIGPLRAMPALAGAEDDAGLAAEVLARLLLGPAEAAGAAFTGRLEARPAGEGGESVLAVRRGARAGGRAGRSGGRDGAGRQAALQLERHVPAFAARLAGDGPLSYDAAVPPLLALLAFRPPPPPPAPRPAPRRRPRPPPPHLRPRRPQLRPRGRRRGAREGPGRGRGGGGAGPGAGAAHEAVETAKALLVLLQRFGPELRAARGRPSRPPPPPRRRRVGAPAAARGAAAALARLRLRRRHRPLHPPPRGLLGGPEEPALRASALRAAFFPSGPDCGPAPPAPQRPPRRSRRRPAPRGHPCGVPLRWLTEGCGAGPGGPGAKALPAVARAAVVRGLLAATALPALCAPLGGGRTLLCDAAGALCEAADAAPPDPPLRCFAFHSAGLLLERLRAGLSGGGYGAGRPRGPGLGRAAAGAAGAPPAGGVGGVGRPVPRHGPAGAHPPRRPPRRRGGAAGPAGPAPPSFARAAADALLAADPASRVGSPPRPPAPPEARAQGRYGPLAALVPRVGARELLSRRPALLAEAAAALADPAVTPAAGTLWAALLDRLRSEAAAEARPPPPPASRGALAEAG
eukprot:tig00001057_g6701.t1